MNARTVVIPAALALTVGCGSSEHTDNSAQLSTMAFALSGGDFSGNSVQICGSRPAPDGKYRCNSSLSSEDGGACPCFNFDASGNLIDPNTGGPLVIDGLCPSVDFPNADWTFMYSIFSEPNCMGTQLNDGTHNFTCFDSHDLAAMANPNESVEVLNPGANTNHVLCVTENASKQFNFESCAITTTPEDLEVGQTRFDCGCTPTSTGACDCGPDGIGPGDLPGDCNFDPASCGIVCSSLIPSSCEPGASQAILVHGTDVVAYVPLGSWTSGPTGIAAVNVEGSSITPTIIPTPAIVNSCASNSATGETVCTANDNQIYILQGTTLTSTLISAGTGVLTFSGGNCTNCSVSIDTFHNRAAIGLSLAGRGGYQLLDLATHTLQAPFLSQSTIGGFGEISEGALIDPIRHLLLNATENNGFEVIDLATPTAPSFFERLVTVEPGELLNATGEDCETGIILAPAEFSIPSQVFIADLNQATFTPGTPAGSWTGPSQLQTLTESILPGAGASAVAVAQGTHIGIVNDEFGGATITAVRLPSSAGSGTPAVTDWVSCNITATFSNGLDPHVTNAYKSPTTGHAIATVGNFPLTVLAVIDLTAMLDPTIVPRTAAPSGGHLCTTPGGVLPSSVVRLVPIP